MNITLCGSIAFYQDMLNAKEQLETLGHQVELPPMTIQNAEGTMIPVEEYYALRKQASDADAWVWDAKQRAMNAHFAKIEWADAIVVLNYTKNGVTDYIGGNTLLEMGVAMHLGKAMYLLNNIPDVPYKEEILGMKPVLLHGKIHTLT